MGYQSKVKGALDFRIKSLAQRHGCIPGCTQCRGDSECDLHMQGFLARTDSGHFSNIEEFGLVFFGEGKAYSLEADIKALVAYSQTHGVDVHGAVVVCGEDPGDIWRLVCTGTAVQMEVAKIVWPDGTESKV